ALLALTCRANPGDADECHWRFCVQHSRVLAVCKKCLDLASDAGAHCQQHPFVPVDKCLALRVSCEPCWAAVARTVTYERFIESRFALPLPCLARLCPITVACHCVWA